MTYPVVEYICESDKKAGWKAYQCSKCGAVIHSPYGPERVRCGCPKPCNQWPDFSDTKAWLALFSAAIGLTQAAAICRYIRWRFRGSKLEDLPPEIPRPVLPPLGKGPGTELKKILSELGVSPTSGCNCEAVAQEMDLAWSVGRFNEHRASYMDHLQTAYNEADVLTKLRAWGNAKMQGKPCTLAGLLTLAIERSAAQA
jgi:hypothetical protein